MYTLAKETVQPETQLEFLSIQGNAKCLWNNLWIFWASKVHQNNYLISIVSAPRQILQHDLYSAKSPSYACIVPILQTHAYTHASASTSLHTRWTSKQAKRTRSRRRTRKKSNIQTPTSRTTRLTCRNQDAWCECGKYKAQQTQFLSHRSLKKQLKTPNRTEQLEEITKKMRRRNLWLQKTQNSLGKEPKRCWRPSKKHPNGFQICVQTPSESKVALGHA